MLRVFSLMNQCTLGFIFRQLSIKKVKTFSRVEQYFIFIFIGLNRTQILLDSWVNDDWLISDNTGIYRSITDIRWESKCSKESWLVKINLSLLAL
jgi:hypothetical protein